MYSYATALELPWFCTIVQSPLDSTVAPQSSMPWAHKLVPQSSRGHSAALCRTAHRQLERSVSEARVD